MVMRNRQQWHGTNDNVPGGSNDERGANACGGDDANSDMDAPNGFFPRQFLADELAAVDMAMAR